MEYNLVISGTIGSWWGSCSADYVRYVLNQNKGKEVHVGFCSLGGFVKDGLEINQAFKDHGNVHAHAFGMSHPTWVRGLKHVINTVLSNLLMSHPTWAH